MYYYLAALLLGGLFYYLLIQKRRSNALNNHAELQARVLIDPQSNDCNRIYGCFIFQVNCLDESLREVVLTSLQCANKHIHINHFDQLDFFISPGQKGESGMRSIGISFSLSYMQHYKPKKESLILKGYYRELKGKRKEFFCTKYFQIEALNMADEKDKDIRNSTLTG
ncbi:hypothetical protein GCM10022216_32270 [Sphingobacterium kyonggiense]|uniref:Uncharacterized protein n=1 Tax=Sphingobacterium kyonggiense TaxID=714075 RepID=A0ABP7Z440_9SPHI